MERDALLLLVVKIMATEVDGITIFKFQLLNKIEGRLN